MGDYFFLLRPDEDDGLRCRKHPAAQPPTGGVCPACLRTRLLRLCPDCAGERPCGCSCPSTTTSTASPSSSLSSLDLPRSGAAGARVGAVGRVSHLIDSEPALRRSRSAAFRLLRPRPDTDADASGGCREDAAASRGEGGRARSWLWPFARTRKGDDEGARTAAARLSRSRSVGVVAGAYAVPHPVGVHGVGGGDVRWKGWNRYFPSPMKAFRHRKPSKVVKPRSPLCRG